MNKVKFSDRHISVGGVISVALGSVAILLALIAIVISFACGGQGGLIVGAIGMASFLFDVGGLIIGLLSFKESDKYYTTSIIGSMMCGIFFLFIASVILMGI